MQSNVSDCLKLVRCIYKDATAQCAADVSDLRDLMTIESRVKEEGLSFLTITLPQFGKDFDKSLSEGRIDPSYFREFRKYGAIPAFLRGMLGLLFDHETGRIYDEENTASSDFPSLVTCVRSIAYAFKKILVECTDQRVRAALENFITVERSFQDFSLPEEEAMRFRSVSSVLWGSMLRDLRVDMLQPRHGPGATADRISGNQKYIWRRWHQRLEPYFPIVDTGIFVSQFLDGELDSVSLVPEEEEQPVRVIPVPKTLKSPRIIAIEPHCMQYTQQGIQAALRDRIESNPRTKGQINFTDQSVNQSLAMSSSIDGQYATIDLSDASDRVPHELAMEMFHSNPDLQGAIEACRSTRAELPDGRIIGPLRKFASMGSALCFPVESMYFYTICVAALLEAEFLPVSTYGVDFVAPMVFVYGDDIIVPRKHAAIVLDYLQKYNCKVNRNKTHVSGNFRESCGVDAYRGWDVTPTYVNTLRPKNKQQASEVISWVSTANLFYKRGYWRTASHMFNCVERIVGPLPYVSDDSPALGRFSYLGYKTVHRWSPRRKSKKANFVGFTDFQRFEVKALVPSPIYRTDKLEGYGALFKSLLKLTDLKNQSVYQDTLHLERSALYGAVAIKLRWVPAL